MDEYKEVEHKACYIPVDKLELLENNPRTISKAQFEKLKKSVDERRAYFEGRPCLVNAKNGRLTVFAGNQRLRAARGLGLPAVPCVVYENLTKKEEKELTVLDNGEFGRWDTEILANEYSDLPLEELMGEEYDKIATDMPTTEVIEDEPPEVAEDEPAKSEVGGVYQLGGHRLMCGDSTSEEQVAILMDGALADMVFTDPPYGVSYAEKNEFLNALGEGHRLTKSIENDSKTPEQMYDFWTKAFGLLHKFSAENMTYYVTAPQGGDLLLLLLLQALRDSGFMLKHQLVWNKNNHVLGRCDYNYKHEPIIYGWKIGGQHKFNGAGKFKTSVWDIPKPQKSDLHPTMKPVELVANALLDGCADGESALDLFGGSGSTLIAAEQTGRKCFMMEIDPHYCDVIRKRFVKFTTGSEDNWEELAPRLEVK